ncbi:Heavy metal-associated isoprenylated plant protein [Actinidia chinensis var. chinensis]|uniref:Heavy metal-associated isoprenylated plant protein n=1 Tax=Actinidia chinensis var. chinensis TaxID=1590841 RepID=A0A2R6RV25_ACTCC|nr:Heavy metal-associated isoprenylated plant protein [Actinidia chinensis var. chinensis]
MSDEVTTMVLKVVDLHCDSCYKKIKKVLCKFPEIRNQEYDEKANTVKITVVCCNPEKMREKLRCNGGKTIKSIEIIKKTKETEKTKEKEQKVDEKTKESGKGKETAKTEESKKGKETAKTEESGKGKEVLPGKVCCRQCYEGHYRGPCYQGYGRLCYDGCRCGCGYGYYDGCRCGYGSGYCKTKICYVSRCDYFNEENTSGCTIM